MFTTNEGDASDVEDIKGDIRFRSDVNFLQDSFKDLASTSNYKNVTPLRYEILIPTTDNEIHEFEMMVKKSFYEKDGKGKRHRVHSGIWLIN